VIRLLIAVALATATASPLSSDLRKVYESKDNDVWYFNPLSFMYEPDESDRLLEAEFHVIYKSHQFDNAMEADQNWNFDCTQKLARLSSERRVVRKGSRVKVYWRQVESHESSVETGSVGRALLDYACGPDAPEPFPQNVTDTGLHG
jgi:hypothetical protein